MADDRDDFDARLSERLTAAEGRIPATEAARSAESLGSAAGPGWMRPALIGLTAAFGVLAAAVLIGQLPNRGPGSATQSPDAGVSDQARSGDLVMTLSSPRSTWSTEEAIQIAATISLDGERDEVDLWGGAGPIVFSLRQISGGSAETGGGQDLPCIAYPVSQEAPLVVPYAKAGAIEGPPFDLAWYQDPELHLPAGRWKARATFNGSVDDCGGDRVEMTVAIQFEVVAAGASNEPASTVAPNPTPDSMPSPSEPTVTEPPVAPPSPWACAGALGWGVLDADPDGQPILVIGDDEQEVKLVFAHPEAFRIEMEPQLTIYTNDGVLVAKEGDFVQGGGGFNADDSVFTTCGIARFPARSIVECSIPVADCDTALNAAGELIARNLDSNLVHVTVNWGRGLAWHVEVHACFENGDYRLVDVGKADGGQATASFRDQARDDPPCD